MAEINLGRTILLVTGVSLRAEQGDRKLAYRLTDEIIKRLGAESAWKPLVISDVLMPGGTGPELVQLLGQKRPGLSALYISGHADGAIARHAAVPRVEHLLEKPFSSTDLLTKIRQILSAA